MQTPDLRSIGKRWLPALFKLLVVGLLVWGVSSTLRQALDELVQHRPAVDPWWMAAAAGLYLAGMLPSGLFWHRILRAMDQQAALPATLRAFYIGHLGKYVPGKAMVVILRAGLLRRAGVDTVVAGASVFLETLTMMAVGAFLSALILLLAFPQHWLLLLIALGLMLGSGLPTLLPVFRRLVRLLPARFPGFHDAFDQVTFRLMAGGWIAVAGGWVLMGLSLWAVLAGLGVTGISPLYDLPLLTASVALAVVAGFLSLIPGGAVVRELILTELMHERFGPATAVVAALLLRLVWLVAELLISGILYYAFDRDSGV